MDDKIWNCADAVGWSYQTQPILLTVDLGAPQNIARVGIRFLGGKSQAVLGLPKKITVLASNDNITFSPVTQTEKLNSADSVVPGDATHFYIPEVGTDFVHTFTFDIGITARYIRIEAVTDGGFLFTDEFAVIQGTTGTFATNWNTEYWRGRMEWLSATAGVSLSGTKTVQFTASPSYSLTNYTTNGSNNSTDLTDNSLAFKNYTGSFRYDGRIWFCADAVGWNTIVNDTTLILDLGTAKAIRRLSVRALGGAEQSVLIYPKKFEVLASNDGVQYYTVGSLDKLMPGDASQADNVTSFYYDESGTPCVHTFNFDLNIQARFVALRVTPDGSWFFTDELAVLEAFPGSTVSTSWNTPENKTTVITSGLGVAPRKNDLYISTNIVTPNWFVTRDARSAAERSEQVKTILQIPQGISMTVPGFSCSNTAISGTTPPMQQWTLTGTLSPAGTTTPDRIYFSVTSGSNIEGSIGTMYTTRSSQSYAPENATTFAIHTVTMPTVPAITAIDVGNGWVIDGSVNEWPNYMDTIKTLGFNQISTFPRYYYTGTNFTGTSVSTVLCQQAVAKGLKIAYMESPFHVLQTTAKANNWADCFNQISGTAGTYLSPIYRGTHFYDEITRVQSLAMDVYPDFVYFDIELWNAAVNESRRDPAMTSAIAASGKTDAQFFNDLGFEMMTDLKMAIQTARPAAIGLYNNSPQIPVFHQVFKWTQIYPACVDLAMPSLYVHGDATRVHDVIKSCRASMGNRQIIPWLTGGTYGEFDSKWIEPMILETILNGARGFIYYSFGDLDPMDYYYHARALSELAPYQSLLSFGAPAALTVDNTSLPATCFKSSSSDQALVLIGNYKSSTAATVNITSPVSLAPGTIRNVVSGAYLTPAAQTTVAVPAQGFVLLYYSTAGHP